MLTTTRRGIQYPDPARTDRPDIPLHLGYLAAAIDTSAIYNQGTDAARIAAAHVASGGRFWWTTDTLRLWYDDGATWRVVSGGKLDYSQRVTNLSGNTLQTIVAGNSVTYDGTEVRLELFVGQWAIATNNAVAHILKDGSDVWTGILATPGGGGVCGVFYDTPSAAAHTYSAQVSSPGGQTYTITASATNPTYLRVTRA